MSAYIFILYSKDEYFFENWNTNTSNFDLVVNYLEVLIVTTPFIN